MVSGAVWAKEMNTHEHWEIEVVFRVSGRGRIGADGLVNHMFIVYFINIDFLLTLSFSFYQVKSDCLLITNKDKTSICKTLQLQGWRPFPCRVILWPFCFATITNFCL